MTEPVRDRLLTSNTLEAGRQLCAGVIAVAICLVAPTPLHAAPAEAAPAEAAAADAPPVDVPSEALVRAALDDGDLSTASELAVARSEAEPSAANYQLEAEVWEALGDHGQARRAYGAALDDLPEGADEREMIQNELDELEAASRGTKADEPESTHRERIDGERADRLAALLPKPPPPVVIDTPKREPIVKKWYFWVTVAAIAASAGAIVGIAISTTIEDNNEANGTSAARKPTPAGGVVFRF